MKIFKLNFRLYIISDSLIAQAHASDVNSNQIQTQDVFYKISSEGSDAEGRSESDPRSSKVGTR